MARTHRLTKDEIIEITFNLLRKEGPDAISINRIAKELETSTQPISWQFGSMDTLRNELLVRATAYMNARITAAISRGGHSKTPSAALASVGKRSVDFVYDEPNVSAFIRFTRGQKDKRTMIPSYDELKIALAKEFSEYGVTNDMAAAFIRDCIIYTQGLSVLISNGAIAGSRASFHRMQEEFGISRLVSMGIPRKVVLQHLGVKEDN